VYVSVSDGGPWIEWAKRTRTASVHFMCVKKYCLSERARCVVTLKAHKRVFCRKNEVTTSRLTPKPKRYMTFHSETKWYVTFHSHTQTVRHVSLRNQTVTSHSETKWYVTSHSDTKTARDVSLRNQNGMWRLTQAPKRHVTSHSETKTVCDVTLRNQMVRDVSLRIQTVREVPVWDKETCEISLWCQEEREFQTLRSPSLHIRQALGHRCLRCTYFWTVHLLTEGSQNVNHWAGQGRRRGVTRLIHIPVSNRSPLCNIPDETSDMDNFGRTESLASTGSQTPVHPSNSLVTTVTELPLSHEV
jgi:hypothetical protein